MSPNGDDALSAAIALSEAEGGLSIGVVHVITQVDLDLTGELSADAKRRVAVERAFPAIWRRIAEVLERLERNEDEIEVDVFVRVAAVHLSRSQERIADELLATAEEHGARRVVLGRRGRPDCVTEYVLRRGMREDAPGVSATVHVVELSPSADG
jgi:hypothetical protein